MTPKKTKNSEQMINIMINPSTVDGCHKFHERSLGRSCFSHCWGGHQSHLAFGFTAIRLNDIYALLPWAWSLQVPWLLFRCMRNRFAQAMQLPPSANSRGLRMPPRTGGLPLKVLPKTGDTPPENRARRSLDLSSLRDASGRPRGHLGNFQTGGRHLCIDRSLPGACVLPQPW